MQILTLSVRFRALALDESCLPALRFQIIHIMCRDGNYDDVSWDQTSFSGIKAATVYRHIVNHILATMSIDPVYMITLAM